VTVYFEWGLTTSYGYETTPQAMSATGSFSDNLTGLSANNTYHFRAKAVGDGTTFGNDITFITSPIQPLVVTVAASSVATTSATLNGSLTSLGTAASVTVSFEWGLTTSYSHETAPQVMSATGIFIESLTDLIPGIPYHFRAVVVGDGSAVYGDDALFATLRPPDTTAPVISAVNSSGITASGVTITWTTDEAATGQVEYGLTTAYGSTETEGSDAVKNHTVYLTGLEASGTYHYRVTSNDAANNQAVSADATFTTATMTVTAPSGGGMPPWEKLIIMFSAVGAIVSLFILRTRLAKK
jgi:hypothetical protein